MRKIKPSTTIKRLHRNTFAVKFAPEDGGDPQVAGVSAISLRAFARLVIHDGFDLSSSERSACKAWAAGKGIR